MLIVLEKIGWGMLALTGFVGGIIGLALPVIPQVPFFLLALFALSIVVPVLEKFHAKRQPKNRVRMVEAKQD